MFIIIIIIIVIIITITIIIIVIIIIIITIIIILLSVSQFHGTELTRIAQLLAEYSTIASQLYANECAIIFKMIYIVLVSTCLKTC